MRSLAARAIADSDLPEIHDIVIGLREGSRYSNWFAGLDSQL
jgi:hypothetical protein